MRKSLAVPAVPGVNGFPASPDLGAFFQNTNDGRPYIWDAGRWLACDSQETFTFTASGVLTVRTGVSRQYLDGTYAFVSARASANTAPTGAALIVDMNKNGTTIFTTQSNRPQIAVSTNTNLSSTAQVTTFAAGDYITVDIDQIGSTVAGSDLTVNLNLVRYHT
jgi:hypothetical protein